MSDADLRLAADGDGLKQNEVIRGFLEQPRTRGGWQRAAVGLLAVVEPDMRDREWLDCMIAKLQRVFRPSAETGNPVGRQWRAGRYVSIRAVSVRLLPYSLRPAQRCSDVEWLELAGSSDWSGFLEAARTRGRTMECEAVQHCGVRWL